MVAEQNDLLTVIRFVSPDIAQKYDFDVPEYSGLDQVVEVSNENSHRL